MRFPLLWGVLVVVGIGLRDDVLIWFWGIVFDAMNVLKLRLQCASCKGMHAMKVDNEYRQDAVYILPCPFPSTNIDKPRVAESGIISATNGWV